MSDLDKFYPTSKDRLRRFARNYISAYHLLRGTPSFTTTAMSQSSTGKRKRQSQDLSQTSVTTTKSALEYIHNRSEIVDRKRLPPVSYRLHQAKYLVMDKMLKSMFFPLMTTKLHFAMSSFSGTNLANADVLNAGGVVTPQEQLRTRGLWRGLVMFNVRNTDGMITRWTTNALNPLTTTVGSYSGADAGGNSVAGEIKSAYRRFHSQPATTSGASVPPDAIRVANEGPTLTDQDSSITGSIRSLDLGSNLSDIEENSVAGMCYADPAISQYRLRSVTATDAHQELAVNAGTMQDEEGPDVGNVSLTYTGPSQDNYFTSLENAVIRIVDGYIHMDIMNTEQTPSVIEIVIHSKKKNNLSKQQIFTQVYNDVNRYVKGKLATQDAPPNSQESGGWQAFWDPAYPLLKLPSGSRALDYISEVHRSNHVLAPGQSKVVKIYLGNLWYKLGNKADINDDEQNDNDAQTFSKFKWNAGSLFFTIGHSGFEYPQNAAAIPLETLSSVVTEPDTGLANSGGSGFWVGKSYAPSSISIDAQYCDKFYPMTVDRSPNPQFNCGLRRTAFTTGDYAVPAATIIPQRVAASAGVVQNLTND